MSHLLPKQAAEHQFVFQSSSFSSCHASTIVETDIGLVAAWFGGPSEGHVDVSIWLSRNIGGVWSSPIVVADGIESPELRYPCWNPVLFQPSIGPLLLFYKVGPSPQRWWGMVMESDNNGESWSNPRSLPEGILGPIKNKPVQLRTGEIICPSSTEDSGWHIHFERSADLGRTWRSSGPIDAGSEIRAIQPSILQHADGVLQAIGRTQNGALFTTLSQDCGLTWSSLRLINVANPDSGTDALTLSDGRFLLIYNDSATERSPLNLAVSDDGYEWVNILEIENDPWEYSYPAIIQTRDQMIHITYTWRRKRIKHVAIDLARL